MRTLVLLALFGWTAAATIIDQIAITVGNQAITQTEIKREIKLSSLLNGRAPDFGETQRGAASDRLIEQALIRREMSFGSYPPASPAQIDAAYVEAANAHGGESALKADLSRYGLSVKDLRDYLEWQIELLRFIDLRFRPAVQVSREDIRKSYELNYKTVDGAVAPPLRDVRAQIETKLTGERVDQQVDQWLKDQRSQTSLHFLDTSLGKSTRGKSGTPNSATRSRITAPSGDAPSASSPSPESSLRPRARAGSLQIVPL